MTKKSSTDVLSVDNLAIGFEAPEGFIEAVKGVSFTVERGKTVALVGESGSGKSVISQAIMGILPKTARITSGSILLNDERPEEIGGGKHLDIVTLPQYGKTMRQVRGGSISIIFQEPMTSLSLLHTIGDQISEAVLLHRNCSKAEANDAAEEMLNKVGFPDPKRALRTYPFELSGGLRQRAMIAMALVCRPALLIADEPTTALDVSVQAQILQLINDLKTEFNMAVLMITHDLGVVANVADSAVVMYHGEVMESGDLQDIFRNPKHPYLQALLRAVPRFHMESGERLVPLRSIDSNRRRTYADRQRLALIDGKSPILECSNISKSFAIRKQGFLSGGKTVKIPAVEHVSLSVRRGECLGLVGESGCGKTTLSKILMRAMSPDTGEIKFYPEPNKQVDVLSLQNESLKDFYRQVQFVFQDPFASLNPRMTVRDILCEPLQVHNIGTQSERIAKAQDMMQLIGLDQRFLQRYPHSFSGGQRQRIGIARALMLQPQLLLCDEPVSALDVSIQAQILNLLKDLKSQMGLTYIFISHNLAVVDYIADRIAVMCRGRIVESAPAKVLFGDPRHPYTRGLLKAVPEPNLDHLLDFENILSEKSSQPHLWEAPFTDNGEVPMMFQDLGDEHFVYCQAQEAAA